MKYSVDKQDSYIVFSINEENVNSVLAPDLKAKFILLANEGNPSMILDVSQVSYIDSSGLSAILTANRLWKGQNKEFVLTGIDSPSVKKLIEISRLGTVLSIQDNLQSAIGYVILEDRKKELTADNDSDS